MVLFGELCGGKYPHKGVPRAAEFRVQGWVQGFGFSLPKRKNPIKTTVLIKLSYKSFHATLGNLEFRG